MVRGAGITEWPLMRGRLLRRTSCPARCQWHVWPTPMYWQLTFISLYPHPSPPLAGPVGGWARASVTGALMKRGGGREVGATPPPPWATEFFPRQVRIGTSEDPCPMGDQGALS